ncbi:MAG: DUF502 domain-containing protein [Pseudomonadota bacterium]
MTKERGEKDENREGDDVALIKPQRVSFWGGLRSNFLAGVVVAAPIGITIALIYWFVTGPMRRLDVFVKRWLPDGSGVIDAILQYTPGIGVLIAVLFLMLLGALARNFIGRSLIRAGEEIFDSMPIVRNLYRFFKNVFETALQQSERSFKEVALVQYPRPGLWVMAFVVGDAKGEMKYVLRDHSAEVVSVFVPTVPNPTSGFLLFVPRDDMRVLTMSVEEAAKVVFSMGLVVPPFDGPEDAAKKLEELAAKAEAEPQPKSLKERFFKIKS